MIVKSGRGFSVVEVLVVLGLIGILAATVFMNLSCSDTGTREQTLKDYEAKNGNICANLGSSYPPDYAKY